MQFSLVYFNSCAVNEPLVVNVVVAAGPTLTSADTDENICDTANDDGGDTADGFVAVVVVIGRGVVIVLAAVVLVLLLL